MSYVLASSNSRSTSTTPVATPTCFVFFLQILQPCENIFFIIQLHTTDTSTVRPSPLMRQTRRCHFQPTHASRIKNHLPYHLYPTCLAYIRDQRWWFRGRTCLWTRWWVKCRNLERLQVVFVALPSEGQWIVLHPLDRLWLFHVCVTNRFNKMWFLLNLIATLPRRGCVKIRSSCNMRFPVVSDRCEWPARRFTWIISRRHLTLFPGVTASGCVSCKPWHVQIRLAWTKGCGWHGCFRAASGAKTGRRIADM